MTEVRVGSWIVDMAAGTATEGNLVVTIISESDGTFAVQLSGDVSREDRIRIGREALDVFERAPAVTLLRNGNDAVCSEASRVFRRQFQLSHAAISRSSRAA